MIIFKHKNGGIAIPIQEFHKIQQKNLIEIKENGRCIKDFDKLSAYYPEIRFKNVYRANEDGTIDIIIDSNIATEISSGFLGRHYYKVLRIKKEKGFLGSEKWKYIETVQLPEREIIQNFYDSLPISDIEDIFEMLIQNKNSYLTNMEVS
ncbi:hypothetical protein [Lactococcus sp. DD01]|uniref:hypothetical protein n=1 Tax=Lactococcus sp. DD01 TaxID=1776443 RepID=UPI000776335E|nr:hypothetical protein [Lactococcus sp. DD01]KXT61901.1 hypothetical protein LACDD01_01232 [Lactococcus sp. DD01]